MKEMNCSDWLSNKTKKTTVLMALIGQYLTNKKYIQIIAPLFKHKIIINLKQSSHNFFIKSILKIIHV